MPNAVPRALDALPIDHANALERMVDEISRMCSCSSKYYCSFQDTNCDPRIVVAMTGGDKTGLIMAYVQTVKYYISLNSFVDFDRAEYHDVASLIVKDKSIKTHILTIPIIDLNWYTDKA